jgi:hypothetical protein
MIPTSSFPISTSVKMSISLPYSKAINYRSDNLHDGSDIIHYHRENIVN